MVKLFMYLALVQHLDSTWHVTTFPETKEEMSNPNGELQNPI